MLPMSTQSRLVTIAVYPHKLIQLFESEWQVAPERLLAGTSLTLEQLDRPDRLVPLVDVFQMFLNAMVLCPEPDLALRYGRLLLPSEHGQLGLATLTAPTLRDVVALYYNYMAVVAPFLLTHQEERNQHLQVVFEMITDLRADEAFVMELVLMAAFNITERILGDQVRAMSLNFTSPPPAYADRLQEACRGTAHFNASFNGLNIPQSLLDAPIASADPVQHARALQVINERMDQLMARGSFANAVRQYLSRHEGPLPRMTDVADAFSLSVRTFRNRLSQQGETFQGILDAERQRQARQLLAETALSVKEIAWQLGFRESSNFSRVFKRWSGLTPLDFRQSSKQPARRRR